MKIDTTCPNCGAPYAKKLSVIYDEGVSESRIDLVGVSETRAILKTKVATSSTATGIQKSELAQKVAPPRGYSGQPIAESESRAFMLSAAAFFLFMMIAISNAESLFGFFEIFIGGGLVSMSLIHLVINTKPTQEEQDEHNSKVQESNARMKEWESTYMCQQCGSRFIPIDLNK